MRVSTINYAMPRANCSVGGMSRPVAFGNGQEKTQTPIPDLSGIWHNRENVDVILGKEIVDANINKLPMSIQYRRYTNHWAFDTPPISPEVIAKLVERTNGNAQRYWSRPGSQDLTIKVHTKEALGVVIETLQDLFGTKTLKRH